MEIGFFPIAILSTWAWLLEKQDNKWFQIKIYVLM